MASKLAPMLLRTAVRSAPRAPRPQIRAFTVAAPRRSASLSVVRRLCPSSQTPARSDRMLYPPLGGEAMRREEGEDSMTNGLPSSEMGTAYTTPSHTLIPPSG